MALTNKINDRKWKCFFRDKHGPITLWPINRDVANLCNIKDHTSRELEVKLEPRYGISKVGWFTITSGCEVYFPKTFQDKISRIILENKSSYLTVEVKSDKVITKSHMKAFK